MASTTDASSFMSSRSPSLKTGLSTAISGFTSLYESIGSYLSSMIFSSLKTSEDTSIVSMGKQTLSDTTENIPAREREKPRKTYPTLTPVELGATADPLTREKIAFLRTEQQRARRGMEYGSGPQPTRPTTQTQLCERDVVPRRSQTGRKGVPTDRIAERLRRQIGR
jgi:hypothetical protein